MTEAVVVPTIGVGEGRGLAPGDGLGCWIPYVVNVCLSVPA